MNKTLATILGTVIIAAGGTYTFTENQVATLEQTVQDVQTQKQEILKQYIYSQATSGRIPEIDLSLADTKEVADAYVEILKDKGDDLADKADPNLFTRIQTKATERDELVCSNANK